MVSLAVLFVVICFVFVIWLVCYSCSFCVFVNLLFYLYVCVVVDVFVCLLDCCVFRLRFLFLCFVGCLFFLLFLCVGVSFLFVVRWFVV